MDRYKLAGALTGFGIEWSVRHLQAKRPRPIIQGVNGLVILSRSKKLVVGGLPLYYSGRINQGDAMQRREEWSAIVKVWGVIVLCVMAGVFLLFGNIFAETFQWDRNTESDMKDYQVFACFTPNCVLVKSATTLQSGAVLQPAIGTIPSYTIALTGKEGTIGVLARDLSLNESALSVLPFDSKGPVSPVNPRLVP